MQGVTRWQDRVDMLLAFRAGPPPRASQGKRSVRASRASAVAFHAGCDATLGRKPFDVPEVQVEHAMEPNGLG